MSCALLYKKGLWTSTLRIFQCLFPLIIEFLFGWIRSSRINTSFPWRFWMVLWSLRPECSIFLSHWVVLSADRSSRNPKDSFFFWRIDNFTSMCLSIDHSVLFFLVYSVLFLSVDSSCFLFQESFLKLYHKVFLFAVPVILLPTSEVPNVWNSGASAYVALISLLASFFFFFYLLFSLISSLMLQLGEFFETLQLCFEILFLRWNYVITFFKIHGVYLVTIFISCTETSF